jgi:hypothetical protein
VTECLDDLASDFSVFHRIEDITVLPARTFLRLADRICAYGGATLAWVRSQKQAEAALSRRAAAMPVATAAELQQLLAPAPGVGMYGVVRQVKADG